MSVLALPAVARATCRSAAGPRISRALTNGVVPPRPSAVGELKRDSVRASFSSTSCRTRTTIVHDTVDDWDDDEDDLSAEPDEIVKTDPVALAQTHYEDPLPEEEDAAENGPSSADHHPSFLSGRGPPATTKLPGRSSISIAEQEDQQHHPDDEHGEPDVSLPAYLRPKTKLPFFVKRSASDNLPIYVFKKNNRTLAFTVIRKIRGDVKELKAQLEVLTRSRVVEEPGGVLQIHGNCRNSVRRYLEGIGL